MNCVLLKRRCRKKSESGSRNTEKSWFQHNAIVLPLCNAVSWSKMTLGIKRLSRVRFVSDSEMAEIKTNKRLVKCLRKGSQDAKRKKGTAADLRSRSYR